MRHGSPGAFAFVTPDAVADRVELRLHAGFAHPAEHQLVRLARFGRKEHARQAPVQLGMLRERRAALHDSFGGQHAPIL